MKNQLITSIRLTFDKCIQLVLDICESEIEKIFILKIIDYVLKRPDRFGLGFILQEVETEIIRGNEVITSEVNYQMPDDFGYLSGFRIHNLIDQTFIEIFPQRKISIFASDNISHDINYRLDFEIIKYNNTNPKIVLKKYNVECDGFDFHNTKDQLKRDNERMRKLLLFEDFTTIRYLGTEIHNMNEDDVGLFIWNL